MLVDSSYISNMAGLISDFLYYKHVQLFVILHCIYLNLAFFSTKTTLVCVKGYRRLYVLLFH